MSTKDEIRHQLKKQRDKLSLNEQQNLSSKICLRLFQTEAYKNCEMIFPYMSFRSEVDTKEIIRQSLLDGKKVYLPRVTEDDMDFYEIHDLDGLTRSRFGIQEPQEDEKLLYKDEYADVKSKENMLAYRSRLMLMPGLAFDVYGSRIGYGAGYYDRYLAAHTESHFYKVALAYDFQVVESINADEFDIKADAVLTPTRLIII